MEIIIKNCNNIEEALISIGEFAWYANSPVEKRCIT